MVNPDFCQIMRFGINRRSYLKGIGTAAVGASVSGCIGDDGSEELVIGGIYDRSGPTSDIGEPYARGAIDGMQYIVDEGLLDVELTHEWSDYAYDVEEARALYEDYGDDDAPLIIGWGTADTEALAPRAAQDEVVYLSGSSSSHLLNPDTPYNFFSLLDYTSMGRAGLDWVRENDPGATVSFVYPQTAFGTGILDGVNAWADRHDMDLGPELVVNIGDSSAETQLRRADDADVDYLFHQTIPTPNQVLLSDLDDLGFDMTVIGMAFSFDENYVVPNPEIYEGHMFLNNTRPFAQVEAEGAEGWDAIETAINEYRDGDFDDLNNANLLYVRGFSHARMAMKGIEGALDAEGEVTGPGIRDAFFDMGETDLWELLEVPIEFDRDARTPRRPTYTTAIYEVRDGQFQLEGTQTLPDDVDWEGY